MTQRNRLRVTKGFLTTGPSMAMDSVSRNRDDEPEPGTIEIHNHIPEFGREPDYGALTSEEIQDRRHRDLRDRRPRDDEPDIEDPDEEFVELLPQDCFARETEDGRTAIYRRKNHDSRHMHSAEHENLAFHDRRARRTGDQRPPHTLAEMNQFLAAYYPRRKTTAAR